jgi:hypothetical protein
MTEAVYTTRNTAIAASRLVRGPQVDHVVVCREGFERYKLQVQWNDGSVYFYQQLLMFAISTAGDN